MSLRINLLIAAVTALLIVALEVFLNQKNIPLQGGYQFIAYAILFLGLLAGCYFFSRNMDTGEVAFKDYFANGFRLLALSLIALMVFRLAAYHLFPSLKIMLLAGLRHSMESTHSTPAEIEQNLGRANSNFTLGMIAGTLFSYAVPGIVSVLFTSYIFAKRKV